MTAGSDSNYAKRISLVALLCILQWLVICQETVGRFLAGHLRCIYDLLRPLLPVKGRTKIRGSKPDFPSSVAIILTEEYADSETLDKLATLIYW